MDKKTGTLIKQITRPFSLFMLILTIVNAAVLALFSISYYVGEEKRDGSRLGKNAALEFEAYESLDWLLDYWVQHHADMDLVYDDQAALDAMEQTLRDKVPGMGEMISVTDDMIGKMDDESRKLYAELCYSTLCREFDKMKQTHEPLFLYSFRIVDGKMFFFVTGTMEDEKRISEGGDIFELGLAVDYIPGVYPVMDKIIETGQPVDKMELSRGKGADRSVIHTFSPVYGKNGMSAIVGVSYRSSQLISQALRMMETMLAISVLFFAVMMIVVIRHIRNIVIEPLDKETMIIGEYENTKDSRAASVQLDSIKTNNELERLAASFSSMVTELDRYVEEIRTVTAEKERIGAELSVATRIQADMLPSDFPAFPDRKEFDLYAGMTPAKEVGGDFYDFFLVDDDHIALVMADVSGKGVPAALFMVRAKTIIKYRTLLGGTLSEVLAFANEQLCEHNESELFVTIWMAVIEISTGKGVAANAGHEHPAIKHKDGKWELAVYKHSPAVATIEGLNFAQHEFCLVPGDSLFVYTDGVAEATDSSDKLFGTERMLSALNRDADADPMNLLENVKTDIDAFVGKAPQFDDITMMCFKYEGSSSFD
ncbi:MAG: SpoIIE family protein phosphatase [Lachnospiraceae bacterium]|nr:SpoIIE family protein phosphatase [Lachnospiraceae bacterium]